MAHNESINFIDIGRRIMSEQKSRSRDMIEVGLRRDFNWTDDQAWVATDPYYDEKKFIPTAGRTKRK
jgi:hypothetical protein